MSQAVLKSRQQKQAYICQNVDPDMYEDFHDFCNSYSGEIDIDKWTLSYVYQLVAKFKEFLIQKSKQQDKHEKSFAIYQTTTNQHQISGSVVNQVQINTVLQTLNQPSKPVQQTIKSPNNPKKNQIQSTVEDKSKAFSKKQAEYARINKQKQAQKPKNVQKVKNQISNKQFFDSVNFWQVPKVEQSQLKKNFETPKFPQSPKKQQKTIKLNINPNQINANMKKNQSNNRQEQSVNNKMNQQKKNVKTSLPKSSSPQDFNEFFTMNVPQVQSKNKNIANQNKTIKASNSPVNFKSQFDTFSIIADQQINKKRTSTISFEAPSQSQQMRKKSSTNLGSTIKLKQVKDLKSSSPSQIIKQPYKGPKVFQNQFTDQVFCVKTASRPLMAEQQLKVELKNYQIKQRSIFSSNYIMYNMNVLPNARICKRNYQDFSKLKSTLQKFYPGIQMPYLQKIGWRSDTTQQYAKKQGQMLQFFMADLLRNNEIRNSRIIQQFLTIQDHKIIKRKFEQYDKMTKLKSIEELCLLEGKVQVALTQKYRIYNQNMGKFVVKVENNIQKYRKYCQNISQYYSHIMSTVLTIDDVLKEIKKDTQDFNKSVHLKQIQNLQKSIKKIRDNYKENYFRTKFEKGIIDDSVLPFLKYEKQNVHVSKDIIDLSSSLTSRYLKRLESEKIQSSDSSYLSSAYKQYKQGIIEQSKNIVVLKYQVGYMQAQASSQLQRIMQSLGIKIDNLWKQIGNKYLDQFARSINVYSSIV